MAFTTRLLAWYDRGHRDLPWRRTANPWAIWVSEIMLQQTRVEAVRNRYERFMARYPQPADFAAVDEDELLAAWRGLGYYRRARLLRAGAQAVLVDHHGAVPRQLDALLALPGIGPYTGGAIASIAFGQIVPAVDGNVERVLARHRGIRSLIKSGDGARTVRAAVTELLDPARPGDFNQAMMELGATVCTPTSPTCQACPVATDCVALAADLIGELPVLPARRASIEVSPRVVVVRRHGNRVLGARIPAGEINAGQVDLPGAGPLTNCAAEDLADTLRARFGQSFEIEAEFGSVRHTITHHRIRMRAHWATGPAQPKPPLMSAAPTDPAVPWTTLARKVFRLARLAGLAGLDRPAAASESAT